MCCTVAGREAAPRWPRLRQDGGSGGGVGGSMSQGLLVLVGVDTAPGVEPLAYARSDVEELRALVPAELVGEPLLDPTEQQVRDQLDALSEAQKDSGGPLL